jgi:hypothetical protein
MLVRTDGGCLVARRSETSPPVGGESALGSTLAIDRFVPCYDLVVVHAGVFPIPQEQTYRAARNLNLLEDPVIRALLGLRSLPQRLADRVTRHPDVTPAAAPQHRFRLEDMVGPTLGWVLLSEVPDVEIVLGQVGRPWKPIGAFEGPVVSPAAFASFDSPGFAKIAFSLSVQPHGATSSILTLETRVVMTDTASRRRFTRYWRLVAPFIRLIDRMTLRLLAAQLRQTTPVPSKSSGAV